MRTTDDLELQSQFAYSAMVDDILASINDGRLTVGQRIASETMLKEQYQISITSIKRGLGLLVDRGILRLQRGSGTYVAGRDRAAVSPLVRRDTLAIVRNWDFWRYHPFYSEQYNGVLAGFAKYGWKPLELGLQESGQHDGRDVSFRPMNPGILRHEFQTRHELAGIVSLQGSDSVLATIAACELPCVCTKPGTMPYVAYDWQVERERKFRIALRDGARDLAVVSSFRDADLRADLQRAAAALGLAPDTVKMTLLPCTASQQGTELTHDAYNLTAAAFARPNSFDGVVITGDFELLGVIDALARLPRSRWQALKLVAFMNKETQLRTRLPMTVLMADGYACGIALAEMIHDMVTTHGGRFSRITMACQEVDLI